MKRIISIGIAAALCLSTVTLGGCNKEKEAQKMSTTISVETEIAKTGELKIESSYIGTASSSESVNVVPLAAGTVESVLVKVGDEVREGDLLCTFDDSAAQLALDSARAAVDTAKAGKKSANTQQDLSSIQTDSSIETLKSNLKTYNDALKSANTQLKKLKESAGALETAMKTTKKAFTGAKTRSKTAQALYIQFKAFLEANPDCQTTAGLTAAMAEVVTVPTPAVTPGQTPQETAVTPEPTPKAKTATGLMQALTKAGLTVEYLSETGLSALKEDVTDTETAYTQAATAYQESNGGIATLESQIATLKSQISGTKQGIETARSSQKASGQMRKDSNAVYDAQINQAEIGVDSAEYQASLYELRAPMNGVVDTVNVKKDEIFGNGMPAFVISGKQTIDVTFYVTEEVRDFIYKGQEVSISGNNNEFEGQISEIGTSVDQQKGLFKVVAQVYLDTAESMAPGSSVTVTMTTSEMTESIVIPYDSVYYEDNQPYVFCVEDGKAVRVDVETGLYNEDTIAIVSGIEQGTKVVTTWASGLKNGAKVQEQTKEQ